MNSSGGLIGQCVPPTVERDRRAWWTPKSMCALTVFLPNFGLFFRIGVAFLKAIDRTMWFILSVEKRAAGVLCLERVLFGILHFWVQNFTIFVRSTQYQRYSAYNVRHTSVISILKMDDSLSFCECLLLIAVMNMKLLWLLPTENCNRLSAPIVVYFESLTFITL